MKLGGDLKREAGEVGGEKNNLTYIRNQFIQGVKDRGYNSANLPQGWPSQINLNSLIGKLKN
jgi:hypothetical protein